MDNHANVSPTIDGPYTCCCGEKYELDYDICPKCLEHTTPVYFDDEGNEVDENGKLIA